VARIYLNKFSITCIYHILCSPKLQNWAKAEDLFSLTC